MAPKKSLLDRMKAKPHGDWVISDIETVCKQTGLSLMRPSSGSHFKVYSDYLDGILPIPSARPIKPVYIRKLVRLIEAHLKATKTGKGGR